MSKQSSRTDFPAGDFISEDAVRGALGRRRRARHAAPAAAEGTSGHHSGAAASASSYARRMTPLRRWSVAELVARALVQRPVDGTSHLR